MSLAVESIHHPGFDIREEMSARGWTQRDLAYILGCSERYVSMLLNGKRRIGPKMAAALGAAFDQGNVGVFPRRRTVSASWFLSLQKNYDIAHASDPHPGVAERARFRAARKPEDITTKQDAEPSVWERLAAQEKALETIHEALDRLSRANNSWLSDYAWKLRGIIGSSRAAPAQEKHNGNEKN